MIIQTIVAAAIILTAVVTTTAANAAIFNGGPPPLTLREKIIHDVWTQICNDPAIGKYLVNNPNCILLRGGR